VTFDEAVQEVKRRVDIAGVIGRSVKLKRAGRGMVGLCPFHQEKTPSFNVHPNDGYFKCFGCDAKGDVFSFLERTTGQTFFEILKGLAEETGVTLPEENRSPAELERRERSQRLKRVLNLTQIFFRQTLMDGKKGGAARSYLTQTRGLAESEWEAWGLGFAGHEGEGLQQFLKQEGVSAKDAVDAGVVAEGRNGFYDFYRGRVTIPIRNRQGEVIAFGGRIFAEHAKDRPKYVNGPLTATYDKGRTFYGLFEALPHIRKGKPAVLVEGYFDVIATHRTGFPTGLSICGTSLTDDHVRMLKRATDKVTLCLDSDSAGQKATESAILKFLVGGFDVGLCQMVEKDPDAMVQSGQEEAFRHSLATAPAALDVVIQKAVEEATGSVRARLKAIERVLLFLAAPAQELERRQYTKAAAKALAEDEEFLWGEVEGRGRQALQQFLRSGASAEAVAARTSRKNARNGAGANRSSDGRNVTKNSQVAPKVKWTDSEKSLARVLLEHPVLAPRCGVLVEVLRNPELQDFACALTDTLVRFHNLAPRDALLRVPIHRGSVLAQIFVEVHGAGSGNTDHPFLSEMDAMRLIEDFIVRMDRQVLDKQLGELQLQIQTASEVADDLEVKRLMAIQNETVQMLCRHGLRDAESVQNSGARQLDGDTSAPQPLSAPPKFLSGMAAEPGLASPSMGGDNADAAHQLAVSRDSPPDSTQSLASVTSRDAEEPIPEEDEDFLW
jgi:DNA primase catalytic core